MQSSTRSIIKWCKVNKHEADGESKKLTCTPPIHPQTLTEIIVENPVFEEVTTEFKTPSIEPEFKYARLPDEENQLASGENEAKTNTICCTEYGRMAAASPFIAGSIFLSWDEILDGLEAIGKDGSIGIIRNSNYLFYIINGSFLIYTVAFDGRNTYKGLNETLDLLKLGKLPQEWVDLNLSKSQMRNALIKSGIVASLSTLAEILNALDIAEGAGWPLAASCVAVPLGSVAFILSEILKIPDAFIKNAANAPSPYYFISEVISKPTMRLPSMLCSMLFSFGTATKWLKVTSPQGQIAILVGVTLPRGISDYIYNGDKNTETLDSFFKEIVRIVRDSHQNYQELKPELCRPHALIRSLYNSFPRGEQISAAISASGLAYFLSCIQSRLTTETFETLAFPYANEYQNNFVKEKILPYITLLYTAQMWVNYTGVLYEPMSYVTSKVRNCLSSTFSSVSSGISSLCCWKKRGTMFERVESTEEVSPSILDRSDLNTPFLPKA